ncbi:IPT/TIG domain-containing protein [Pedobacter sp. GR22-6]|uniref:IPT/TIG domain-containing protein n=1 Tax=Pedobacter sp. GR22-6 TaxID=3127957 RepID=UPI00307D2B04
MKRFILSMAVLLAIASSCKKSDDFSGPQVQTVSLTALSPTTVVFTGNLTKVGKPKVIDHGFIYSNNTNTLDETTGIIVSLGADISEGNFTKTVNALKINNYNSYQNIIFARAYVKDEKGTAFGAVVNVTLPSPSAGNIQPSSGKSGDVVTINGKFYSPNLSDVKVAFQNINAKVISANDTEIAVEIPTGIPARHGYTIGVSVTIGNIPVITSSSFTILANVKDYSPKSGPIGTMISFTGDNLLAEYSNGNAFVVHFGEKQALIVYGSQMQTQVPSGLSGKTQVSIAYNGQKLLLPGEFTISPSEISRVTPETVMPGEVLRIYGTNFPTQQNSYESNPMVKLGNAAYENAYYDYQGYYNFSVPENTPEGSHILTLKLGSTELAAPQKITVRGYSVSGFSPQTGAPGSVVNITGNFRTGTGYYVFFGASQVYAEATSATNLRAAVPNGINAGKVKLSAQLGNKRFTAPGEFEVNGPSITSFSPTAAIAGTIITIKGSGFYPGDYYTTVKFGTISIQAIKVTENTITVAVPSNLNPGAMRLTIVTGGQEIMADANFTATN